ncbi:hypothetical protein CFP56_000706 [Quercus suber]|uniref:Transmembrane protein n=1 Tax=Quercus suber TaxID=58331 RepID=A0AAW0INV6_QUESU
MIQTTTKHDNKTFVPLSSPLNLMILLLLLHLPPLPTILLPSPSEFSLSLTHSLPLVFHGIYNIHPHIYIYIYFFFGFFVVCVEGGNEMKRCCWFGFVNDMNL